jgi:hypothetical protein
MESKQSVEKVDIEELIKEFKVINVDIFATYLKEVWKVDITNPRIYHKGVMIR